MRRLQHVISFTSDIAKSRDFYRDAIGLKVVADTPFMVNFANGGTGLMLLALSPGQKQEVELCFESDNVASAVDQLRARGVQFIDELRQLAFGSVIHFRDPEGNLLSILQPGGAAKDGSGTRSAARTESAEAGSRRRQTSLALEDRRTVTGPRLSAAFINCDDIVAARAYFTHQLGLRVSVDAPAWIQFDTGEVPLALHSLRDRHSSLALAQPVSFGFSVPDMDEWVEAARDRGVPFVSAPADEGLGLTAEIVDPEGNVVVVREPLSQETIEERLAEDYEDDVPARSAIRSPARKVEHHTSWVAQRPDYKPGKKPAAPSAESVERAAERVARAPSPRGTGPVRSRMKPKRANDPERVKTRPAVGHLKKAEARTLGTAKRAAADASKSKPVKRASARKTARAAKPKKAARRPPRRG
jgi:catechol 2,3-dioxygenase-like lactoylglutathione lyase family enzyme